MRSCLWLLVLGCLASASDLNKELAGAAKNGDVKSVDDLLSKGADVNYQDKEGRAALHFAAENGHEAIVKLLLDMGADPTLQDEKTRTPVTLAEAKSHGNLVTMLKEAIEQDAGDRYGCELKPITSDGEKGKQDRVFAAPREIVEEIVVDSLLAIGCVLDKDSQAKLTRDKGNIDLVEGRRVNPSVAGVGGGAGRETIIAEFEESASNGQKGVKVTVETKKGFVGRLRQHNWSTAVLDEAECLLKMLHSPTRTSEGASVQSITLPNGTPVKLRLRNFLGTRYAKQDDRVQLLVAEDVTVEGITVIRKGDRAEARITTGQETGGFGRDAELQFRLESVSAVDGTAIRLRSSDRAIGGTGKGTTAANIARYRAWGFLVRGRDKGLRAGTRVVAYVDNDVKVASRLTAAK